MWRKMRGHISMLQPHMIAVKLGRMEALSLPAGMGLWERRGTACNRATCQAVAGEEERGTSSPYCTSTLHTGSEHCTSMLNRRVLLLYGTYLLRYESTAIVL